MMRIFLILFCLFFLFFFSGCDCRGKKSTQHLSLMAEGDADVSGGQRQKEDFHRSIGQLNSLEDAPCLPDTPGYEKLVSIADRLDKWIQRRSPDESWQPDSELRELETALRTAVTAALETVQLLNLLQGKNVVTQDGKPLIPSSSLEDERKNVTEHLTRLVKELQAAAQHCGIPGIADYAKLVDKIREKFAGLEKIPNLNASGIRAFAKQLEKETQELANVAAMLERYGSELRIEGLFIQLSDVEYVKQCTWARNLSNWARGDKQVLLERVVNLLDWVTYNIDFREKTVQISQNQSIEMPQQYPWQTMLLGYGAAWDRTWLFMELLRQQRIDSVLLAVPVPAQAVPASVPNVQVWAVGVLLDGEIYLFMPHYGMPLPGPEGPRMADDGSLSFPNIATFSQVLKDGSLLRQLDLSEKQKFPITSAMLQKTTVYLLAVPESASLRMKVLETELDGEQNMVLYTNIQEQRRLFSEVPSVSAAEVWRYPLRTKFEQLFMGRQTNLFMGVLAVQNPKRQEQQERQGAPLWSGRVLYFKGKISGQGSAITKYQNARVPDRDIMELRNLDADFRKNPVLAAAIQTMTIHASYWLGTASFEAGSILSAKDFFTGLELNTLNPWRNGVEYALGRIAEREKNYGDAVKHYKQTANSPSGLGNSLRAKWLQETLEKNKR
jgi:hypothetical protein